MQLSFFSPAQQHDNVSATTREISNDLSTLSKINGLTYLTDFITKEEHDFLWQHVNSEQWLGDLKRRVQHYGYKYDYKARFIDYSMKIGDLPFWVTAIVLKLKNENYIPELSDQLIINEYVPGQGIASHIDCEPCFGDTIVSLSLGSACVMEFMNKVSKEKIEILLEPRSLVILKSEARYDWTHGIRAKKTDNFKGVKINRKTRISLTFRNVLLQKCETKK